MSNDQIIIFDTTMRDGEQSPGASMTKDEKIQIAKSLEAMKVDVIEAGFPIASVGDFESVHAVASTVKNSIVCGLARSMKADIERAAEALKPAARGRIHTFIATSPIHMREKLRMQPDEVVEQAVAAVKLARQFTDDVEFSPEDAGRSDPDFLCRVLEAVIDAGATTLNIPDTVGYAVPEQFGELINNLITRIPNSDKAIFSVHCHNDLGLAVANSLAAVRNGARQVECTINGLGERAGNAALEEVVMALRTRPDFFNVETQIDTTQIVPTSSLVSGIVGFPIQPNKAIVGANAFAHESGIHQDGVLKSRETYEIMRAEDVGWSNEQIVLGKHSGRNAFRTRCEEIGIRFDSQQELNDTFTAFKALADKKHEIYDDDLRSLVSHQEAAAERLSYVAIRATIETGEEPQMSLTIAVDGEEKKVEITSEQEPNGIVDAAFKAILLLTGDLVGEVELQHYQVSSVTTGTDSQGETTVRLKHSDTIANGQSTDTDTVVSSVKAYVNALNKLLSLEERDQPKGV